MNTLPVPSTASPVNAAPPATSTRWSGAWPGTCSAVNGPKRPPSPSAGQAPTGGLAEPGAQPVEPLRVVGVVVRQRDPARAAALGHRRGDGVEVRVSAGPGSTTQAGSRPTTHVFVPSSV